MPASWLGKLGRSQLDDEQLLWSKVTGTTEDLAVPPDIRNTTEPRSPNPCFPRGKSYSNALPFGLEETTSEESSDGEDVPPPAPRGWIGTFGETRKSRWASSDDSVEFLEREIVELECGVDELFADTSGADASDKPAVLINMWEDRRTHHLKSSMEMAAVFFSLLLLSFVVLLVHNRFMPEHLKRNSTVLIRLDGFAKSVQSSWHGWLGYFGFEHSPMVLPMSEDEDHFEEPTAD